MSADKTTLAVRSGPQARKMGPLSFASLYTTAFGFGIISVAEPLVSVLCGVQFDHGGDQRVSVLARVTSFGAGAAGLGLLAVTVTLHWLEHRRFTQLHGYMTKQAEAGATVELAIERTREQMEREIAQAGSYFHWLVSRRR